MEETLKEDLAAETLPMNEVERESNQGHQEVIAAARTQVESLLTAITVQAGTATSKMQELEQVIGFAVTSRTDIETQLTAIKEATLALTQQIEAAKPLFAELTTLQTNI